MSQGPIIPITINGLDSAAYSPRAVIVILPYKNRIVNVTSPKKTPAFTNDIFSLNGNPIIISDDILNLTISTDKKGVSHTLTAGLASGTYNYLSLSNPGDWILGFIVNNLSLKDNLIKRITQQAQVNQYDSGLKFIGQVHTIQEQFKQSPAGPKQVRYNLNATGFNPYNAQIVYSPFLTQGDGSPAKNYLFTQDMFSTIAGNTNKISNEIIDNLFSIQDEIIRIHQLFLGPGPGNKPEADGLPRTVNNSFGIPLELGKLLGQPTDKTNGRADSSLTFSDIMVALIGIQKFASNNNSKNIGPDFIVRGDASFGTYYQPKNIVDTSEIGPCDENAAKGDKKKSLRLRGRKMLNTNPSIGGSIWSILQAHANLVLNEMYVCLRPDVKGDSPDIVPTFVTRQIPFTLKTNTALSATLFKELPRFQIDKSIIMNYDFSKSEALRTNTFLINATAVVGQGQQHVEKALNIDAGPWMYDINDIKRHGVRIYKAQISDDQFVFTDTKTSILNDYNEILNDYWQNLHLRYSGSLQTIGVQDPITVGENLQIGDVIFHIETVNHSYAVGAGGLTSFYTSFNLSNGVHDADLVPYDNFSALPPTNTQKDDFATIKGGFSKELFNQDIPQSDPRPPAGKSQSLPASNNSGETA